MTKQKTKWIEFDVVKGLLALLPVEKITSDESILQSALYNLYKNPKYKRFLKEYLFDINGHFPFSRDFETTLVNMKMSGIMYTYGLNFKEYTLNPKLKTSFEKHTKPLFNESELETLTQMSKEFFAYIKSKTP